MTVAHCLRQQLGIDGLPQGERQDKQLRSYANAVRSASSRRPFPGLHGRPFSVYARLSCESGSGFLSADSDRRIGA